MSEQNKLLFQDSNTNGDSGSLVGVAEAYLINQIERQILRPGDPIDFAQLAKELKFSRTPIRESMRQLHSAGLVDSRKGGHYSVRRLSKANIEAFRPVLLELDSNATSMAAENITDQELALLARNFEIFCDADGKPELITRADKQFHEIIYDAARNRYLSNRLKSLRLLLLLLPESYRSDVDKHKNDIEDHRRILNALQSGSADTAMDAAREHTQAMLRLS